jgi:hypothetical protein
VFRVIFGLLTNASGFSLLTKDHIISIGNCFF